MHRPLPDVFQQMAYRNGLDLDKALASGKKIVVPYCVDGELELFHLEQTDKLSVGMYRILEPKPELRTVAGGVAWFEPSEALGRGGLA